MIKFILIFNYQYSFKVSKVEITILISKVEELLIIFLMRRKEMKGSKE